MRKWIVGVVALFGLTLGLAPLGVGADTGPYEPNKASLDKHVAPKWYNDAKFGIFIHWGAYSVPAYAPAPANVPVGGFPYTFNLQYAEWYWRNSSIPGAPSWQHHRDTYGPDVVYDDFIDRWQAQRWDPNDWVRVFKDAGAQYFVLTAKHHEGLDLFPSKTTNRTTVQFGPHRDIVGDLFTAAREQGGIHPALYYSIYEWYNPSYHGINDSGMTLFNGPATGPYNPFYPDPTNPPSGFKAVPYKGYIPITSYVDQHLQPQLHELIDNYQPDLLWCDGAWDNSVDYWKLHNMMAYYYNDAIKRNKEVVVNDRCGNSSHADYSTNEYSSQSQAQAAKWEATRGIGLSFGYNEEEEKTGKYYLSSDQLIDFLVDVVSKNGNLLLDIGPKADGTIPTSMLSRLHDIGDWLRINGEAIYGSTYNNPAADTNAAGNLRFTVKPDAFYMTALQWPGTSITVPVTDNVPIKDNSLIYLLGYDQPLKWTKNSDGGFTVQMPAVGEYATPSQYAFSFKITNKPQPTPTPTATGTAQSGAPTPTGTAPTATATGSATTATVTPTGGTSVPPTPTRTAQATMTTEFRQYVPFVTR